VIGPKKLSVIRQELRRALETTGHDPIDWLQARIVAVECERPAASGEGEILRSLMRFLAEKPRSKGRVKRPLRTKK
jgi:hypothetical protein